MTETFWRAVGGRKVAAGLLYAVLITVMAFPLHADFIAYATALATGLLGTSALVVVEDVNRPTPTPSPEEPLPEGS